MAEGGEDEGERGEGGDGGKEEGCGAKRLPAGEIEGGRGEWRRGGLLHAVSLGVFRSGAAYREIIVHFISAYAYAMLMTCIVAWGRNYGI